MFENEFANRCGTDKAIAMANGSLAFFCLSCCRFRNADELITRVLLSQPLCAALLGAKPIFADVTRLWIDNCEHCTLNPVPRPFRGSLRSWPADMPAIRDLAFSQFICCLKTVLGPEPVLMDNQWKFWLFCLGFAR